VPGTTASRLAPYELTTDVLSNQTVGYFIDKKMGFRSPKIKPSFFYFVKYAQGTKRGYKVYERVL
jgi:hypothetical protein